jgi:hypothetical protein
VSLFVIVVLMAVFATGLFYAGIHLENRSSEPLVAPIKLMTHPTHASADVDEGILASVTWRCAGCNERPYRLLEQGKQTIWNEPRSRSIDVTLSMGVDGGMLHRPLYRGSQQYENHGALRQRPIEVYHNCN